MSRLSAWWRGGHWVAKYDNGTVRKRTPDLISGIQKSNFSADLASSSPAGRLARRLYSLRLEALTLDLGPDGKVLVTVRGIRQANGQGSHDFPLDRFNGSAGAITSPSALTATSISLASAINSLINLVSGAWVLSF